MLNSVTLTTLSVIAREPIWKNLTLRHMSTVHSPFSIRLITSNQY